MPHTFVLVSCMYFVYLRLRGEIIYMLVFLIAYELHIEAIQCFDSLHAKLFLKPIQIRHRELTISENIDLCSFQLCRTSAAQ